MGERIISLQDQILKFGFEEFMQFSGEKNNTKKKL